MREASWTPRFRLLICIWPTDISTLDSGSHLRALCRKGPRLQGGSSEPLGRLSRVVAALKCTFFNWGKFPGILKESDKIAWGNGSTSGSKFLLLSIEKENTTGFTWVYRYFLPLLFYLFLINFFLEGSFFNALEKDWRSKHLLWRKAEGIGSFPSGKK